MYIFAHKLAVSVMVLKEDKILLVKEKRRGWEFPGGFVGDKEPLMEAAIREVKEESGIDIEIQSFCGVYRNDKKSTCVFQFIGKAIGGDISVDAECLEAGFFTIKEAIERITSSSFKSRIQDCLEKEKHPFIKEVL